MLIEAWLRVIEVLTGQHHSPLDDDGAEATVHKTLGTERHRAAAGNRGLRFGAVIDHAQLQRGGTADDVLGLGGVLNARQLHDHAVQSLLLNHRLGHAQLIDPVVQRGDVLLQRGVLHGHLGRRLERARQAQIQPIS